VALDLRPKLEINILWLSASASRFFLISRLSLDMPGSVLSLIYCLATSTRHDLIVLILPLQFLISTTCPMINYTFRKSRFSVSRLISSSSLSKPIIACCPSPLPRSFILASFQMLQERLNLRPGKYLLLIVYPDAKYDLTAQNSRHSGSPKYPPIKMRRLRRHAYAMLGVYVKYDHISCFWPYPLSC
jgi:hypothetical protein